MTKQGKLAIIITILVGTIVAVFLLKETSGDTKNPSTLKKVAYSNWKKRFDNFDKNPMGTYLFNRILQAHIGKNHIYEIDSWNQLDSLHKDSLALPTYLFVGHSFGITEDETHDILSKVSEGSTAYLSFNIASNNFIDSLIDEYIFSFVYKESVDVKSEKDIFNVINLYQMDTLATNWNVLSEYVHRFPENIITSIDGYANCISFKIGEGNLILQTTPSLFYNYQVQTDNGFKHAELIANLLPKNQNIYSLEIGRLTDEYGNYDEYDEDGEAGGEDNSLLQFVFENKTLLFAFILAIFTAILFLIFRAKRLHPIVPYLAPKKDVTIVFAETITSIYLSRDNPYGLLNIQKKNFYSSVQKHFFIDISKKEREKAITRLAEKSNISQHEIESLLALLETAKVSSVDENYIINTSKKIREFYQKTKIISDSTIAKIGFRELTIKRSFVLPAILILAGLFFFFYGTYFLVIAMGVGIALWPISFILLALGITRLSNPVMKIRKDDIVLYSVLGKKKVFSNDDVLKAEILSNGYTFHIKNGKKYRINNFEVSNFDRKQLHNYVSQLNELEL